MVDKVSSVVVSSEEKVSPVCHEQAEPQACDDGHFMNADHVARMRQLEESQRVRKCQPSQRILKP
jgi:hypothetical protein